MRTLRELENELDEFQRDIGTEVEGNDEKCEKAIELLTELIEMKKALLLGSAIQDEEDVYQHKLIEKDIIQKQLRSEQTKK